MLIDAYLCTSCGWRRRTGLEEDGSPILSPPPAEPPDRIKARIEFGSRLVRDVMGEELLSETTLITSAPVNPGDIIVIKGRETPIMAVREVTGLGGDEVLREARLFWQRSASTRGRT